MYKNIVIVACEILFQYFCGFSREQIFIGIFVSSYNLVLSTLQAFIALMLEHRAYGAKPTTIDSHKYKGWLQKRRERKVNGLNDFWRWIIHAIWHGTLITFVVFHSFDGTVEISVDETEPWKTIGQKDASTVVFNIVLHTIFIKLSFELERVSRAALLFIVATIAISYIIITLFSLGSIAPLLHLDLLGISARSVLTLNGFLLLGGICAVILFLEYALMFLRYLPLIVSPAIK